MQTSHPIIGDLVLVGGGHAQIAVLKAFAMKPLPGLRLTLVTNSSRTPYSGMLPGYVEGVWQDEDLHIDLRHLAAAANARMIVATVTGIDADLKQINFDDRPALRFDVLSINIGGQPSLAMIDGAAKHAIPVKPIAKFQTQFEKIIFPKSQQEPAQNLPQNLPQTFSKNLPKKLAVIGGGAAGCELALALITRWKAETGTAPELSLITDKDRLMPQMTPKAAKLVDKTLRAGGADILYGSRVTAIDANTLTLESGKTIGFDACFLVTQVAAPGWLADTGLDLDSDGFVTVTPTLQSTSHPYIFAAGDIAAVSHSPRPKAGVFAVRAGKILARNLRRYILAKPLTSWTPQTHYLALIGIGNRRAIAVRGDVAMAGRLFWHLKCWIDRNFMNKFRKLSIPVAPPIIRFAGLSKTPPSEQDTIALARHDPAFSSMRCLGCAAKTSHQVLQAAMQDAVTLAVQKGANPDLMPPSGLETDSASLPAPPGVSGWIQSVDVLSEIVSDPFLLGEIATVHALSDIYASLAKPLFSLAIINLPETELSIQTNQLTHILAGALLAHSQAGVRLVGGHTSEGGGLSVGFAVTGSTAKLPAEIMLDKDEDLRFILTKPLGTGVIMAAHMQLQAGAVSVDDAIANMRQSNKQAADIFMQNNNIAATDVTGFGLARHAQNLAMRVGITGCTIDLASLPLLGGVTRLFEAGITSSLHEQNQLAVTIHGEDLYHNNRSAVLFDPQTSGGLLGVFAAKDAENAINALVKTGHRAAVIGQLDRQFAGIKLVRGG
ncbi:MAG: selenide, water dikinase SelD [Candidatus Puniceispirillaceae bacterium]